MVADATNTAVPPLRVRAGPAAQQVLSPASGDGVAAASHPRFSEAAANASAAVHAGAKHAIRVGETIYRYSRIFDALEFGFVPYDDVRTHVGGGTIGLVADCGAGSDKYAVTAGHVAAVQADDGTFSEPGADTEYIVHSFKKKVTPRVEWPGEAAPTAQIPEAAATKVGVMYHKIAGHPATDVAVVQLKPGWDMAGSCATYDHIPAAMTHAGWATDEKPKWAAVLAAWDTSVMELLGRGGYPMTVRDRPPPVEAAGADNSKISPFTWAASAINLSVGKTGSRTGFSEGSMVSAGAVFGRVAPGAAALFERPGLVPVFIVLSKRGFGTREGVFAGPADSGSAVHTLAPSAVDGKRIFLGLAVRGMIEDPPAGAAFDPHTAKVYAIVLPVEEVKQRVREMVRCSAGQVLRFCP